MFLKQFFAQLGINTASAITGYIKNQQPSGNPALAAQPVRRSAGLFRTVLITMGAGSGLSFGPFANEMLGFGASGPLGILFGLFGIGCGLCLSMLYAQRYQRSYNGWPWLLLGIASWLGGALLTAVLLAAVIAFLYLAGCYLALLMLPLVVVFVLALFRMFWRY